MCMKIGCPAVSIVGGKAQIDSTLCVGCGLCASKCPKKIIHMFKGE